MVSYTTGQHGYSWRGKLSSYAKATCRKIHLISFMLFSQMAGITRLPSVSLKVCFLSSPFRFALFPPLLFQQMEQNTATHYQPDSSLSFTAGVVSSLPHVRRARQRTLILDWAALQSASPSLLGEHGKAPGPLRSHGREVNGEGRKRGEGGRGRERDSGRVELLHNCHSGLRWVSLSFNHTLT